MKSILLDTGFLYALADPDDSWHESCKHFLEFERRMETLIAPVTIIPEICYFLNKRLGEKAEASFIDSCVQDEIQIENLMRDDYIRALELMRTYPHQEIGFVDASLAAVAERLKINRILTIDRRRFSKFRPKHCSHFTLLPD